MSIYQSALIVDDDPIQITILKAYFAGINVPVVLGAADPAEALQIIKDTDYPLDLIVTDLQMPRMDGLEFLRHLKTLNFKGHLALISGVKNNLLDHAGRLAKMHGLNMIGQIPKPFNKAGLDKVFERAEKLAAPYKLSDNTVITQNDFTNALQANEIVPYFQPKVEMSSGKIIGAEALARWERSDGSVVSPEIFINFAISNGRIEELTFHLFNQVLKKIKPFLEIDKHQKFATNIAPELMNNIALPDQLCDRMRFEGILPKNISFEITENSILNLDSTTLEVLSRLRILDFEVAIDDFGTGSSNIQTLRDFPYSELKIDRSFISNVLNSKFSQETVQATCALAREQDMRIVAEGIEDKATWDFIKAMGIEHAQGFFMSKAMTADDYLSFLIENKQGIDLDQNSNAA